MLDRLIRTFLVVGSVSVACAWTWTGAFPAADPRRPVGRRVGRGHLCAPRPARTWPSPHPPQYPPERRHRERQHDAAQRAHCPHPRRPADRRHRGTPWSSASTPRTASGSRRAGYSRERSRSATSCATPCGTGPITSSSAKCAAPKRPTCCKPSTPDPAARPPRHHPGERLPPRGRAGRPHPAALDHQSVSRRWRGRDR